MFCILILHICKLSVVLYKRVVRDDIFSARVKILPCIIMHNVGCLGCLRVLRTKEPFSKAGLNLSLSKYVDFIPKVDFLS